MTLKESNLPAGYHQIAASTNDAAQRIEPAWGTRQTRIGRFPPDLDCALMLVVFVHSHLDYGHLRPEQMRGIMMHKKLCLAALAILTATSLAPARAEPGGCLKYGAVGAAGGHVAHHGVLGAVGGCTTGMYVRHKYRKEARQKAALYDQEHPGVTGPYEKKATAYDAEHSTAPGNMAPGGH